MSLISFDPTDKLQITNKPTQTEPPYKEVKGVWLAVMQ